MDELFPGKIVVTSPDEKIIYDYASAVPIGLPERHETTTVLSCAHVYTESLKYDSKLFYHDFLGAVYELDTVLLREDKTFHIPEASEDIALYRLKKTIKSNPLIEIDKFSPKTQHLTTLSYGWALSLSESQTSLKNFNGESAFSFDGLFTYDDAGTHSRELTADRIVSLFDENQYALSYLAKADNQVPFSQNYYHDSGAPWFVPKNNTGYSLAALSSRFTPVIAENPTEAKAMVECMLSESSFDDWQDTHYTLRVLKLSQQRQFKTILTSLAPHRDWIYQHTV